MFKATSDLTLNTISSLSQWAAILSGIVAIFFQAITIISGKEITMRANNRLDTANRQIDLNIGGVWTAVEPTKIRALEKAIGVLPKPSSRLLISYQNSNGKPLARSLDDAFKSAGWTTVLMQQAIDPADGLWVGRSKGSAALRLAIEAALEGIHVHPLDEDWADDGDRVVIIGVKPTK